MRIYAPDDGVPEGGVPDGGVPFIIPAGGVPEGAADWLNCGRSPSFMVWFVLVGETWSAGVAIEVPVCTGVDAVLASVCEDALLEFVVQPATRIPATRMLAAISIRILFFFIEETSPEIF